MYFFCLQDTPTSCHMTPVSSSSLPHWPVGLGLTGVPVFNVNNNCSSGSSALMMASLLVQAGYDCTMAVGFEKMDSGLKESFTDRVSPIKGHVDGLRSLGAETGPLNPHVNAVTSDVVRVSGGEIASFGKWGKSVWRENVTPVRELWVDNPNLSFFIVCICVCVFACEWGIGCIVWFVFFFRVVTKLCCFNCCCCCCFPDVCMCS